MIKHMDIRKMTHINTWLIVITVIVEKNNANFLFYKKMSSLKFVRTYLKLTEIKLITSLFHREEKGYSPRLNVLGNY